MRDLKSSNDVLPDKLLSIHILDVGQGLGFNPFGEIVYANQQISLISYCFRERAYNIQAPLSEQPRTGKGIEDPPPPVGGYLEQTSGIDHTSWRILGLPFAYSATNILE